MLASLAGSGFHGDDDVAQLQGSAARRLGFVVVLAVETIANRRSHAA